MFPLDIELTFPFYFQVMEQPQGLDIQKIHITIVH